MVRAPHVNEINVKQVPALILSKKKLNVSKCIETNVNFTFFKHPDNSITKHFCTATFTKVIFKSGILG